MPFIFEDTEPSSRFVFEDKFQFETPEETFAEAYKTPESVFQVSGEGIQVRTELGKPQPKEGSSWGEVIRTGIKATPARVAKGVAGAVRAIGEVGAAISPEGIQTNIFIRDKEEVQRELEAGGEVIGKLGGEAAEFWGDIVTTQEAGLDIEPRTAKAYAYSATASIAQNAPAIIAAALTKKPSIALTAISVPVAGEKFHELREKGFSKASSISAGIGYGIAEYVGEKVPLGILLKPGYPILKRIVLSTLAEIPGELFTETVQLGIDKGTISPEMTIGEAKQRLVDTGIVTVIASPIQAGVIHPFAVAATTKGQQDLKDLRTEIETLPDVYNRPLLERLEYTGEVKQPDTLSEDEKAIVKTEPVESNFIFEEVKPRFVVEEEVIEVTATTPEGIAEELNLTYNGVQEGIGKIPDQHLFTDNTTNSTIAVDSLEKVQAKVEDSRKVHRESDASGETELYAGIPITKIVPKKWRPAWNEFWNPMSTIPNSDELKLARYKIQFGGIDKAEDIVKTMYNKISKFDTEIRTDIFKFLDGQISLSDLPEEARVPAESIRQRTITIGKMLVKRGMISQEAFDKYKGKYVHYMYAKFIIGEDGVVGFGPSGKLDLKYTKERNPNLTEKQKAELGQIEDAAIAVPVGMGKALIDVAKFDYMEQIASNPNWVWMPSIVEIPSIPNLYGDLNLAKIQAVSQSRKTGIDFVVQELEIGVFGLLDPATGNIQGIKMGIGKLAREVDTYKRISKTNPDNVDMRNKYEALNEALQRAEEATENIPSDFKQMPTEAQYGPLAGTFIRKPIADDIIPLISSTIAAHRGHLFHTIVNIETQGMALFKATHVALNPPTAFRNVVSNVIQNNLRGRPLAYIPGDFIAGVKSMKAKDRNFVLAKRHGLFRTNWAVTEINDILNTLEGVDRSNWGSFLAAVGKLSKYYGKIDDISKHVIFVQLMNDGSSVEHAVLEAQKWGMDYSLASRSVKELRRHLVPFATYQYKIAPLLAEVLTKRPWVIGKYIALPYLIAESVRKLYDIDPDEWEKMKRDLPTYIKKNKTYTVLPWKSPEGNWQWVNLEYYFPWGNWLAIYKDIKNQELTELSRDSGIGNPFLDIFQAFKSGVGGKPPLDPYTGKPLYNELDSPTIQNLKILEFLYTKWAPSAFTRNGASAYTLSIGKEDKWGKTITTGQAVGRWFGFNTVSISPKQTKILKSLEIKRLKKELNRILYNPKSSKGDRKKATIRFKAKRREVLGWKPLTKSEK